MPVDVGGERGGRDGRREEGTKEERETEASLRFPGHAWELRSQSGGRRRAKGRMKTSLATHHKDESTVGRPELEGSKGSCSVAD